MKTMAQIEQARATIEDLHLEPGKAELVNGRIIQLMATGRYPNRVASRIFRSLDDHADQIQTGEAYTDNMAFTVPELSSGRESFSPDVSYYTGPFPANPMHFIHGSPDFGAEMRSVNDYGRAAEKALEQKREDYFEAGTLVVWDVDPKKECIRV